MVDSTMPVDDVIATTIQMMQTTGKCCSPVHGHSFRSSSRPLLTFRRVVCVACKEPIVWSPNYFLSTTPTAVECMTCSVVAHRSCADKKGIWNDSNLCEKHGGTALTTSLEGEHEVIDDPSAFEKTKSDGDITKNTLKEEETMQATSPTSSEVFSSSDDEKVPQNTEELPPAATNDRPRRVATYPGLRKQQDSKNFQEDSRKDRSTDTPQKAIDFDPIDSSWEVTVAAIAGGMAGMMIAGPVGAAGGAIAAAAARQQQSQKRMLLLHNGVSVSVRPQIPIDPVWYNYVAQAVRTAPRPKKSPLHADITAVAESEIDTHDKILLLVHRTLNDTTSRSGHMYRYLMAIYQDRVSQSLQESRRRRDDVHAIVRHVTASLVEERPELGAAWTEVTAATVESLVFGQLYDSVMEEIVQETYEGDVALWRKITALEQEEGQSTTELLRSVVSQKAVQALQMLPQSHSATEKLHFCVEFLDCVSQHILDTENENCSADSLLKAVCQHVVYLENNISSYAEMTFLEEFSRDEALLRGREGYALVTLQACLEFLTVTEKISLDALGIERKATS